MEHLLTNEWQEGGLEKILFQGNLLLEATGGVPEAALVLWAVGRVKLGDHFAELGDPRLDEALDADLLAYARTVADRGVRACYGGDRSARVTAEPHASAREHLPEAMSQLWKDARRGRVILCDDRAGDLLPGVLSVLLARVPKMSPDRTLPEEGRTVWDQRVPNEWTDPSAHPPALQPRHWEVIRMILWWTLRLPVSWRRRVSQRHSSGSGSTLTMSPSLGRTSLVTASGSPDGASRPFISASPLASRVPRANGWYGLGL